MVITKAEPSVMARSIYLRSQSWKWGQARVERVQVNKPDNLAEAAIVYN